MVFDFRKGGPELRRAGGKKATIFSLKHNLNLEIKLANFWIQKVYTYVFRTKIY
jgi:hypothetical protein